MAEVTPEQLTVQLGALIAAGHSPREIVEWTWAQAAFAATAVQMYHMDLVTRIVTGKSAVSGPRGSGVGATAPAAPRTEAEEVEQEMALLRALQGGLAGIHGRPGGLGVKISGGPASGGAPPV